MASDKCPSCGAEINQHSPGGRWKRAVTWVQGHPVLTSTAAAAVFAAAALWHLLSGPGQVARLADGVELRLLGVSIGTNEFSTERRWERKARQFLPRRFSARIPQPIRGSVGWTNSLNVWVLLYDPVGKTNVDRSWSRVEAVTDEGNRMTNEGGTGRYVSRRGYQALMIDKFPRRQRSFLLRFCDGQQQLAATLQVPNPWRAKFPEWKAEPLPVTKTNGELAVTLKTWKRIMGESAPGHTSQNMRAEWDFAWKGVPTTDWHLTSWIFRDSTGNWIDHWAPEPFLREKAWQVQGYFSRCEDTTFTSDERFAITDLAIQRSGTFTNLNVATNLQGVGIWLLAWSGPVTLKLSNSIPFQAEPPKNRESYCRLSAKWENNVWGENFNLGRPALLVAKTPTELDREVSFIFRDHQGRLLRTETTPDFVNLHLNKQGIRANDFFLQPEVPAGEETVSVEVIVQRPRVLEFYVAPPLQPEWIPSPWRKQAL